MFPITPRGKTPLTQNGFKDATNEAEVVREWWTRWPSANIGLATGSLYRSGHGGLWQSTGTSADVSLQVGEESGLLVIDIDPRNGGTVPEGLPTTLTAVTGGGGLHYYYTYNPQLVGVGQGFRKVLSTGVDIKAEGGYVIIPPSLTESNYRYLREDAHIEACPDWLLEACQKPHNENLRVETGGVGSDPTDTRPGSIFNRTASWSDILEPHGWVAVYRQDEEVFWRRPGKNEGISATTNYSSSGLFHCFTTSTEFDSGAAYSPFAVYSQLNYGGDFSAAAQSLNADTAITTANLTKREEYTFEPAFPEGHFVTEYISYASKQTDAPREYHEAAALVLLALVTSQCKAKLSPYPSGLATNLYISLVGSTTRSRKSTAQKIALDLAKAVVPAAILPNRATPEALIKALSNKHGIATVWMPDEFGVALAEIYNRDFLSGLEELLLTIYGGDNYEYQRSNDALYIRDPHTSILAASTPESISRSGATALESGLLPRFAVVYPKVLPEPRAVTNASTNLAVERAHLISRLFQIQQWANVNKEITFTDDALRALNESEVHMGSGAGSGRLPTMLYKSAILSLAGTQRRGQDENMVGTIEAETATHVVARWKQGVESLLPLLYKGGSDPAMEAQMEFALGVLRNENGQAPRTVVARAISTTKGKLDVIEQTLLDRGLITLNTQGGKVWVIR